MPWSFSNTFGHSPKARVVVTMIEVRSLESAEVGEQLPARLCEGQGSELAEERSTRSTTL